MTTTNDEMEVATNEVSEVIEDAVDLKAKIEELEKQLLEQKIAREADQNRFELATRLMRQKYEEQSLDIRQRLEKGAKEAEERVLINFILNNVLPVSDTLNEIVRHFEDANPSVSNTVKVALKRITNALNAQGLHEIAVNEGDDYDAEIHNPLDSIPASNPDIVHKAYHNAWTLTKNGQKKVVRFADITITRTED